MSSVPVLKLLHTGGQQIYTTEGSYVQKYNEMASVNNLNAYCEDKSDKLYEYDRRNNNIYLR